MGIAIAIGMYIGNTTATSGGGGGGGGAVTQSLLWFLNNY